MKKYLVLHYRDQRNSLAYYLLDNKILTKRQIAKIWGVVPMAVSAQLPKRK